ncbi:DUF1828 domain-containing protein [Bordetella genomosp. 4]|uniref:DUF1828 domain-containing protein n=1 Tax=Bordetella genomosp. 4 TaxID=463044 RepID=A0A261UBE8_9BORD|nr:DUF1828 domain-containing protein [Bordetella genomosp. 4]OZI45530.1 DUF1828 domain-containing protein [Bordetella genomosp. 4]OZI59244.1 DUF1828 domain-containing protein [Bordetella genomosp. 4]
MTAFLPPAGWTVVPAGERAVRAITPVAMGLDGQHATFYIAHPDDNSFFLTDAGEAAMHAATYGVELTPKRLDQLNQTPGLSLAHFDHSGAITAAGPQSQLQDALWDAIKLTTALTFQCSQWMPKFSRLRFRAEVGRTLAEAVGADRLVQSAKARASSGHTAEFAYAVRSTAGASLTFIEPIALKAGKKIDWTQVYQTHGKMSDVKMADADNSRLVILEDGAAAEEFNKAVSILEQSAIVRPLGKARSWSEIFAN